MLWSWLLDVTWYDWVGGNWAGYAEYAGWVCVNSEHYGCWTPWTHHWLVSVVPAPDHVLTSLSPTTTSIQNIGGYKITKYIKTLCYATHVVTNRILGFVTLKHPFLWDIKLCKENKIFSDIQMMMCEVIYMRVYQPATKLHSLCQATGKKNIEYYYLCKFRVSIHPSFRPSTQVYFSTLPPSIIS